MLLNLSITHFSGLLSTPERWCSYRFSKAWGLLGFLFEAPSLTQEMHNFIFLIFLGGEQAESPGSFSSVWVAMPFLALQIYPPAAPKSFIRRWGDFSPK